MKLNGILAEFSNPKETINAVEKLREKGYKKMETYSPFPIHGMDKAMEVPDSKLGWIVFCMAAIGLFVGIGLQGWSAVIDYPYMVSGKPFFSWQAFIPITFELTILFGAFAAVFGMLFINKLPMLYHPLFQSKNFNKATNDGFFIYIESVDKNFAQEKTKNDLEQIGGKSIEEIFN